MFYRIYLFIRRVGTRISYQLQSRTLESKQISVNGSISQRVLHSAIEIDTPDEKSNFNLIDLLHNGEVFFKGIVQNA